MDQIYPIRAAQVQMFSSSSVSLDDSLLPSVRCYRCIPTFYLLN